jgi:hypothetical protein
MAFDDENEPGDELEDFGDELSSDYKEETEEGLGEEGEEIEEEVSYEIEETVTGSSSRACARAPRHAPQSPGQEKPAKKAAPKPKQPVKKAAKKIAKKAVKPRSLRRKPRRQRRPRRSQGGVKWSFLLRAAGDPPRGGTEQGQRMRSASPVKGACACKGLVRPGTCLPLSPLACAMMPMSRGTIYRQRKPRTAPRHHGFVPGSLSAACAAHRNPGWCGVRTARATS